MFKIIFKIIFKTRPGVQQCAMSSPSPFGLDLGTLDFGTSDSGLTIVFIPPGDEIRHQNYPQKGEENNNLHGEIFVLTVQNS